MCNGFDVQVRGCADAGLIYKIYRCMDVTNDDGLQLTQKIINSVFDHLHICIFAHLHIKKASAHLLIKRAPSIRSQYFQKRLK